MDEDGYLWVVDRMKELIKYKGMQGKSRNNFARPRFIFIDLRYSKT